MKKSYHSRKLKYMLKEIELGHLAQLKTKIQRQINILYLYRFLYCISLRTSALYT